MFSCLLVACVVYSFFGRTRASTLDNFKFDDLLSDIKSVVLFHVLTEESSKISNLRLVCRDFEKFYRFDSMSRQSSVDNAVLFDSLISKYPTVKPIDVLAAIDSHIPPFTNVPADLRNRFLREKYLAGQEDHSFLLNGSVLSAVKYEEDRENRYTGPLFEMAYRMADIGSFRIRRLGKKTIIMPRELSPVLPQITAFLANYDIFRRALELNRKLMNFIDRDFHDHDTQWAAISDLDRECRVITESAYEQFGKPNSRMSTLVDMVKNIMMPKEIPVLLLPKQYSTSFVRPLYSDSAAVRVYHSPMRFLKEHVLVIPRRFPQQSLLTRPFNFVCATNNDCEIDHKDQVERFMVVGAVKDGIDPCLLQLVSRTFHKLASLGHLLNYIDARKLAAIWNEHCFELNYANIQQGKGHYKDLPESFRNLLIATRFAKDKKALDALVESGKLIMTANLEKSLDIMRSQTRLA